MVDIAVVTGGSRGIGAATARLLARRGWSVCISYRQDHEAAEKVVSDLASSAQPFLEALAGVTPDG